jgi:hypothetical protein
MDKKSLPYNSSRGCPDGYHKRRYQSSTGKTVKVSCVRSDTTYKESRANFIKRKKANETKRLLSSAKKIPGMRTLSRKACPPGMIERKPYVRRFSTLVRQKGYTVKKKNGTTYTVHPKAKTSYVKSQCVKDMGLPGKGPSKGQGIGPLRKGELKKFDYSSSKTDVARHLALRKAVKEFGALGVFRKLLAVSNYTLRTQPTKSRIYKADSEWVKNEFKSVFASS